MDLSNKTMYEAVVESMKQNPNGIALYYQGKKIRYTKFVSMINDMADVLYNTLNIREGDVVLLAQPNIPEALVLFYALNKIGAVANMIHPFIPFNQVRLIYRRTNSKVAFLFEQRVAKEVERYREFEGKLYVTRIEDSLPFFKKLAYHFLNRKIRYKLGRFRGKFDGFNYLKDLKPTGKGSPTIPHKKDAVRVLLHSGSTTGDPKTICLSDWNFNFLAERACEDVSCTPEEIKNRGLLAVLPTFHGFGLCTAMHFPLTNQFYAIMVPRFRPKETAKLMKKVNVSFIIGVPTMYESLLKCDEFVNSKHLRDLHVCFCGGDTLSPSLKERWDDAVKKQGGHCQIFEGYGLTEAVCVNAVNTYANNRPKSFGKPNRGVEFRIVDENGQEVERGKIGEITLKSPAIMVGYFKDEENTKKAIRNGWLYTGDLGYMDEDGFIYFTQRKKRVVKVSGVGVFPTEIERLVESIPNVEACCAIRIPDVRLQSAIKIFVIADYFDEEGMKETIMDTCRKYLIRWALPKEIEFRKELPVTQYGKIDFNRLQKEEDEKRGIKE